MTALALLAALPWSGILAMGVAVIGLVLVAGLVAGQFRRGVVQELRESLSTANTELDIERRRGDRLEEAVRGLERRLGTLEAENRVLRETLQTGIRLAPEFQAIISEQLRDHERRSEAMVRAAEEHSKDVARETAAQVITAAETQAGKMVEALEKAMAAFESRKLAALEAAMVNLETRLLDDLSKR